MSKLTDVSDPSLTGHVEFCVPITAIAGLHARPAIKLSRLAKTFKSDIRVRVPGGRWVDAKSIVRLMELRAAEGSRLQFAVAGEDATAAIAGLSALAARGFSDDDENAGD